MGTTIQSPGTQHGRSTRSSSVSKPSGKVVNTLTVQLSPTTIQETSTSRKDLMALPSSQEKKSLSTQSSRKSSLHTLMPLVSTKSQRLPSGLDISKDKPRETRLRESPTRRRLRLR